MVYVPNSKSATVTEIDPTTLTVVRTFGVGRLPQHVVPAYDKTKLWVANNEGNSLTPIDPETGVAGANVHVDDPYNLYFTPDGALALVIAEKRHRIDFRDPTTMALRDSTHVECGGLDHLDFTSDDKYAIATCEFSGQLVKIDLTTRRPMAYLKLQGDAMPQDIRSSPDGTKFYVADMKQDGVHVIDPERFVETNFIKTGKGTHGIVVGRGGTPFYISNRGWNTIFGRPHGEGSITVLDPATEKILATWPLLRRWKSGHGQRLRGWEAVVALRALRRRSLCLRHHHRLARETHSCRARAARSLRLAATGPRLVGPHRQHAVVARAAVPPASTCSEYPQPPRSRATFRVAFAGPMFGATPPSIPSPTPRSSMKKRLVRRATVAPTLARAIALFGVALLAPSRAASAQAPATQAVSAGQLDSIIQKTVTDKHIIGLSVGVMQNGKVVLAKGYGVLTIASSNDSGDAAARCSPSGR